MLRSGHVAKIKGRQIALSKVINTLTGEKISPNAVRKWIKGEGFLSTDKMIQIARWAGVSTEWFLSGAGAKQSGEILNYGSNTTMHKIIRATDRLSENKKSQVLKIVRILSDEGL